MHLGCHEKHLGCPCLTTLAHRAHAWRARARRGSLYAMLHSPSMHLSWAQVAYLCLGAARGMAHLHAHRCLHRDLKSGAGSPGCSVLCSGNSCGVALLQAPTAAQLRPGQARGSPGCFCFLGDPCFLGDFSGMVHLHARRCLYPTLRPSAADRAALFVVGHFRGVAHPPHALLCELEVRRGGPGSFDCLEASCGMTHFHTHRCLHRDLESHATAQGCSVFQGFRGLAHPRARRCLHCDLLLVWLGLSCGTACRQPARGCNVDGEGGRLAHLHILLLPSSVAQIVSRGHSKRPDERASWAV